MTGNDKIKDLERQAQNTRGLMDRLNRAYIGLTVEELLRLALEGKEEKSGGENNPG